MPEHKDVLIRKDMLESAPILAYRFCPAEAEQARELTRKLYANFVAHYGGDLVVFPDGMAVAAAEQELMESALPMADSKTVASTTGQGVQKRSHPRTTLPPEFLNHKQGIGVFANPEEGAELMLGFNHVLSGLRKKGGVLTQDEVRALHGLVTRTVVSPAFVWRLVNEHGGESIVEAFQLRDVSPEWALGFLLRRHKGQFFRKRYPTIAVLQPVD